MSCSSSEVICPPIDQQEPTTKKGGLRDSSVGTSENHPLTPNSSVSSSSTEATTTAKKEDSGKCKKDDLDLPIISFTSTAIFTVLEPYDANAMTLSLYHGQRVMLDKVGNFADGVAVKVVGVGTFNLCKELLDGVVLVNRNAICASIKDMFEEKGASWNQIRCSCTCSCWS